jgi:hypothetical protein
VALNKGKPVSDLGMIGPEVTTAASSDTTTGKTEMGAEWEQRTLGVGE